MGDDFWHPVQETHRLAGGWRIRRNDGVEGGIVEDHGFRVFVHRGELAEYIGGRKTLNEAAWLFWRWGREDRWPKGI